MYTITGGDQKHYGPISADDVRKWIAEGRLNAQSLVKGDADEDFRPLGGFPEFVDALASATASSAAPPPPSGSQGAVGDQAAALQMVKGPAIALIITAILGLILVAIGFVFNILTLSGHPLTMQQINDPQVQRFLSSFAGGLGIVQDIVGLIIGIVILMGASKMQKLQSHSFAVAASIAAMIPCVSPCCFLGLPFGIWALVVLNKPEVKSQFT